MTGIELGVLSCSGEKATTWVASRLEKRALRVYRSFDLRNARAVGSSCACPSHGTDACDCQMVVLLVYREQSAPATVVLHGHEGRTWILLAEASDPELKAEIIAAVTPAYAASAGVPVAWAQPEEAEGGA